MADTHRASRFQAAVGLEYRAARRQAEWAVTDAVRRLSGRGGKRQQGVLEYFERKNIVVDFGQNELGRSTAEGGEQDCYRAQCLRRVDRLLTAQELRAMLAVFQADSSIEAARSMGVSQSRVTQLNQSAVRKLLLACA